MDLATVKAAAEAFLRLEGGENGRLDVLFNNAGTAATYLFMGFSEQVTPEDAASGICVILDGRWHPDGQRKDLLLAFKSVEEGRSGRAAEFFEWAEERVRKFL